MKYAVNATYQGIYGRRIGNRSDDDLSCARYVLPASGRKVVENGDAMAALFKGRHQMRANKAAAFELLFIFLSFCLKLSFAVTPAESVLSALET